MRSKLDFQPRKKINNVHDRWQRRNVRLRGENRFRQILVSHKMSLRKVVISYKYDELGGVFCLIADGIKAVFDCALTW